MVKQFFKYSVAGGAAAAVHFLILIILVEARLTPPTIASGIGFCAACALNYTLQYRWTFAASGSHQVVLARYALVTLIMLGVNLALFWAMTVKAGVYYIVAQVVATGLVVVLNFVVNRHWTFA